MKKLLLTCFLFIASFHLYANDCHELFHNKDYASAVKVCYQEASEQGSDSAQAALGFMYYYGLGVNKDYQQAFYWYKKASEQQNSEAQTNLGLMYLMGNGTKQDLLLAKQYFNHACDKRNPMGCDLYDELNDQGIH